MNLKEYQDIKYRAFQQKLIVSHYPLVGVRIPILRKLAKSINYEEYVNNLKLNYYEDILLYGMILVKEKDESKRLELIEDYIKYIDCWSICDTFCSNLSFVKQDKDKYFAWILSYLKDNRVFYIRFGIVMLLKYYTEDKYLNEILKNIKNITNEDYYCKMAIAWLLCELAVTNKEVIDEFTKDMSLDVYKMYQRKVKDSFRI